MIQFIGKLESAKNLSIYDYKKTQISNIQRNGI